MSSGRHHAEWLSLIEVSGPFLTLPVLIRALPQGLPKVETGKLGLLRAAYEEWAEAQHGTETDSSTIHESWVKLVVNRVLEFDAETLRTGDRLPKGLVLSVPEHHETVRPSMAVVEPAGRVKAGQARLLIASWPRSQKLEEPVAGAQWAASPLERMTQLCRATNVRLGLVTNGERWTLVDAPVGQTAGYASWYAGLWLQEPMTLAAFEALLGVRRFFAVAQTDTLEALLHESVAYQQEVTDQLGYQVRRAVEVLIQALDRADLDRERELLMDVPPERLYEAALTVMMRLVFLFCAEERGLLLLGDETYDLNYAVSTLRAQLREEADVVGVEVLERRQDAWARLLATFRAVYGGVEHEALRLPALGGSLFDPDRYPFLEGRPRGSSWLDAPASPLPIDNRTVLHLLEALQLLKMKGDAGTHEARKLSYRALDIEQIGHVYEGLLDHVAVRVDEDTVGLQGTKDKEPEISIDELDRERRKGHDALVECLKEQTGRSVSALRNALDEEIDEEAEQKLLVACGNDKALLKRVAPYHALLRNDVWGYPQVYRAGSVMVTSGSERRQTGTHYTPKSLTEQIVKETLEPLVYEGPAEGKERAEWRLRTPAELLNLKICDMAMGSAAFLVQVCRWLGERLVEGWEAAERDGKAISADGQVLDRDAGQDLQPTDREERLNLARRLIAEGCVYGVDINPMAVELAKLSLWLVTLAKGRPFGFLDHNLRCGDSLLGVTSLDQLECFHLDPERGRELHTGLFDPKHHIQAAVNEALALRKKLRATRILDIEDVRSMARLDSKAKQLLEMPELVADMIVGASLQTCEPTDDVLQRVAVDVQRALVHGGGDVDPVGVRARQLLDFDCPERLKPRRPFHWSIEFPEVFARERPGFDAIIGNPPFMGGQKLTGALGTSYREYLVRELADGTRGSADLAAYFFLRAHELLRTAGNFGLLAVNTIAEGDTRQIGLERMLKNGATIISAYPNEPWPGKAAVSISRVHVHKGEWHGSRLLLGRSAEHISAFLSEVREWTPKKLDANKGIAFIGSLVWGAGFTLKEHDALEMIRHDARNRDVLFPYLNGLDLNSVPDQRPSRWVVNFWDWQEDKARSYREPYQWILTRVKPERMGLPDTTNDNRRRKRYWWLYGRDAKGLYHAIGRGSRFSEHPTSWDSSRRKFQYVIGTTLTSKHRIFVLIPNDCVIDQTIVAFATDDLEFQGTLQSEIHLAWVIRQGGSLETRPRYIQTDCFETFPLPEKSPGDAATFMRKINVQRTEITTSNSVGLTELYNRFHNPSDSDERIARLRQLHRELDMIVADAYGWGDINLGHGFHRRPNLPQKDQIRFTISDDARAEVLARLSALNRDRHISESS